MKRKDELKIEILSNIKDEIIDKQSAKRYALMNRKRKPKWIIPSSVAAVLLIAIMIPLFIVLFSKQVPVYEGMTVSTTYQSSAAEAGGVTMLSASSSGRTQIDFLKDDNGNHNGHNKKPVEDIVEDKFSSSLTVPEQHMYYAKPSQDIYITVHISNPDSFEILSFTLNGKKYSSYMFEDGSDMENLILKVTVPAGAEGITEYTIDAIKYVDGTAIKDVRMEGNRTVKVGVYSAGKQPTAQIADEIIGINDISFTASINDRLDLIKMSEGNIFVVICDNNSVIYKQELNPDEVNNIKFDSLIMDTTYRYAIVANYDSLDGTSFSTHILYEKEFTTKNIVAFKPASITQSSISFTLEWEESFENKVIDSLALYRGEEKVQELDVNATSVDGLLSNNEYRLVATYTNKGEIETSDLMFTTQAKAEPVFTFKNMASEMYSISGEYDITNIDDTLISYKVELYRGVELVKENTDKEIAFDSLDYYTDYTVKISYTFDVNDGKGVQEKAVEYAIKTLPYIDVTECKIANTSAVSEGDTIFMQVKLDNPLNMSVESVIVNGETYNVTGASTTNKIFVEIVYNGQFAGGDTHIKIDKVNAKIDSTTLAVAPKTELSDNVFINGKLEVLKLEFVNENLEPIDWAFPSETVYVMIMLDNPTGYTVDNINGNSNIALTKLDDNHWYYKPDTWGFGGWRTVSLESLSYKNEYVEKTLTYSNMNISCYVVESDNTVYISAPDDLKNMNGSYYYELTNDIDLSGIEWIGNDFNGVFDGKGYSIKNMSFVGTIKNTIAYLGLFSTSNGVIQNTNVSEATIIADITADDGNIYEAYCGGLVSAAADYGRLKIHRCSVDENSIFNVKSVGAAYVGGLIGYASDTTITNCANSSSVSAMTMCTISNDNSSACAGGLIGFAMQAYDSIVITNSYNSGNVVIAESVYGYRVGAGGLVGGNYHATIFIANSYNSGNINAIHCGGILGHDTDEDPTVINSYSLVLGNDDGQGVSVGGIRCTIDQLNSKEFYTETLGWSEEIWDFSELDYENGKYPKLK